MYMCVRGREQARERERERALKMKRGFQKHMKGAGEMSEGRGK